MASDAQNMLYDIFAGLSGSAGGSVGPALAAVPAQAANHSGAAATRGSEGGGGVAKVAKDILRGGWGLPGLLLPLLGVCGGSEPESPPPLVKYALPAAREFEASQTGSGFAAVDYDQAGRPRAYDAA